MPTKKKRVGFIPREDVMRIIDNLSIENNLSNSKIISILVEEALSTRGMFNKKNGKLDESYQLTNDRSISLYNNSPDFNNNAKISIDPKLRNQFNPGKSTQFIELDQKGFDLQTYKKFISFLRFQEMMDKYDT